ncbi:MAG: hypothetical protein OTI34_01315 [Lewinella sp.]|nr:hypothetical protein [Lewinella sp.]
MDTITLSLAITYLAFTGVGSEMCNTKNIYFDNHNGFMCVSNTEAVDSAGNVTHTQDLYFWNESLLKYDEKTATWDKLPNRSIEYTVDKLDAGKEVVTSFSQEPNSGDVEGTMTFRKQSQYVNTGNLLSLDCPSPSIVTNDFFIKLIPDIADYNISALRRIGAVITWNTDGGRFPVFWSGFTSSSTSFLGDELVFFERQHRESSSLRFSSESITEVVSKHLPSGPTRK